MRKKQRLHNERNAALNASMRTLQYESTKIVEHEKTHGFLYASNSIQIRAWWTNSIVLKIYQTTSFVYKKKILISP